MSWRRFAWLFLLSLIGWVSLNGSVARDIWVSGAAIALVLAAVFARHKSSAPYTRPSTRFLISAVRYGLLFLKELALSNLKIAKVVLSPSLPVNPGIVKVRTSLKSPMGRLLLANSITLTPGTLTLELDGQWFYVHWVTVESEHADDATATIVSGFERHIGAMYG